LLNESIGAGYIDRNWPDFFKESAAWPLTSLRQSFLNGALTRLLDPDTVLRSKIAEFVRNGDFGLAYGSQPDGTYDRVWFKETPPPDEITFEPGVFLLRKARAQTLKSGEKPAMPAVIPEIQPQPKPEVSTGPKPEPEPVPQLKTAAVENRTIRLSVQVPPEMWNRLGTKLIPKLRSGSALQADVEFAVTVKADQAKAMELELRQILEDLGLGGQLRVE
jgi:hypothetical protein